MREQPYPECPAEETLRDVAAEIALPDVAQDTLQHVAQCDHCGPLLNTYLHAFSNELSPEIEALIQELPGSSPEYQREQAREIARQLQTHRTTGHRVPVPRPFMRLRALAWSAAAAAMALFGVVEGPVLYARWQISSAAKLVTIASSMRRTTQLRVPGQIGKPDRIVVRGPDDGNDWTSKPVQLAEAEAIVNRYCRARPDAKCLEIMGRISRQQAEPNSAKNSAADFEKALALRPDDPRLKIELAISYFDQSESEKDPNRRANLDRLIQELLLEALDNPKLQEEDRRVANFDLAISYERSELWPAAIDTWKEYLALDPSGPWRAEAQNNLEKAQKKSLREKPTGYNTPGYFLQHSRDRGVLQGIEQYLEIAVREWLPDAAKNPAGDAALALHKLGDLLLEQHSDTWLKQFVDASGRTGLAEVMQLSAAFTDNTNDLHMRAMKESLNAAAVFSRQKNLPGLALARFEEIYALQRTLQGRECLAKATALGDLLAGTSYGWLRIQVNLEKAACAKMVKDVSGTSSLNASKRLNNKFQYPDLSLRIVGFEAGFDKNQGQYGAAWSKAVGGLHTYWEGSYSWERLYQFYSVMWQCAKRNNSPHAARALILQGIHIFEKSAPEDTSLQAVLYLRLANTLRQEKEDALAEAETAKAVSLLKASVDATAKEYALYTQIDYAEVALRRNNVAPALAALEPVRELLATGNIPIKVEFYGVLAKAYWKSGQLNSAVSAYESAIEATEQSIPEAQGEERLAWLVAANEIYGGLTQVLLAQKKNMEALEIWERFKMLEFANRNSPKIEAPKLSDVDLFHVQTSHLIYASFEDHLQVWVLARGEVRVRSVAVSRADLQRLARELNDDCKSWNADQDVVSELERKLYSYLIQPVLAELSAREPVAIELDQVGDELSQLKVELLKDPQDHYFSDDHTISYSPGILVEKDLRAPLPLQKQEPVLLVIGSGSLPSIEVEREAVIKAYPQSLVIDGKQASRAQIAKALKDQVAFVYGGHAVADSSGMALAVNPSTLMTVADVKPESLRQMRLVILSACASGTAQSGLMDSRNFVRAFLLAGVPNVVASGWYVDSEATALFMQKFYEGLGRGESAAHALDDARKARRAVKPNPYFWAGFSLTGRLT